MVQKVGVRSEFESYGGLRAEMFVIYVGGLQSTLKQHHIACRYAHAVPGIVPQCYRLVSRTCQSGNVTVRVGVTRLPYLRHMNPPLTSH